MKIETLRTTQPGHPLPWYDGFVACYQAMQLQAALKEMPNPFRALRATKKAATSARTAGAKRGRKPGANAVLGFIQKNGPNIPELQIANGLGITPGMLSGLLNTLSSTGKITGSVHTGWTAAGRAAATSISRGRRAA